MFVFYSDILEWVFVYKPLPIPCFAIYTPTAHLPVPALLAQNTRIQNSTRLNLPKMQHLVLSKTLIFLTMHDISICQEHVQCQPVDGSTGTRIEYMANCLCAPVIIIVMALKYRKNDKKDWCHTHAYMHTSRQKNGNDTTADVSSKICIKIQKRQNKKKSHNQQSMLVMRHSLYDEMHSRQWQWQSNHFYAYWTSIRILMKTIAKYLFYHRFKIIKSIIIIISQTFSQTDCSMPKYLVM